MFKSRYFYMMLGAFAGLSGIVVLLNVSTLTFAGDSRHEDDVHEHDIFVPIVSDTSIEQIVPDASVEQYEAMSAAERAKNVDGPKGMEFQAPPPQLDDPTGIEFQVTPLPTSVTDYEETKAHVESELARQSIIQMTGPETRGKEYDIAGKKVQLPPDAELDGVTVAISFGHIAVPEDLDIPYPTPPLLNIKRDRPSDSNIEHYVISIELNTGRIWPRVTQDQSEYTEYIDRFNFLIKEIGEENVVDVVDLMKRLEPFLTPTPRTQP